MASAVKNVPHFFEARSGNTGYRDRTTIAIAMTATTSAMTIILWLDSQEASRSSPLKNFGGSDTIGD